MIEFVDALEMALGPHKVSQLVVAPFIRNEREREKDPIANTSVCGVCVLFPISIQRVKGIQHRRDGGLATTSKVVFFSPQRPRIFVLVDQLKIPCQTHLVNFGLYCQAKFKQHSDFSLIFFPLFSTQLTRRVFFSETKRRSVQVDYQRRVK